MSLLQENFKMTEESDFDRLVIETRKERANEAAMACRIGDLETLKLLVAVDDKVELSKDAIGWQLLHEAAHHGLINWVRLLTGLNSFIFNSLTLKCEMPLIVACKNIPLS
jgi:ankyrin repeat protein